MQQSSLNAEDIEELSTHLEECFLEYANLGLDECDAWLLAKNHLGTNNELNVEFAKVNPDYAVSRNCVMLLWGGTIFFVLQSFFIMLPIYILSTKSIESQTVLWVAVSLVLTTIIFISIKGRTVAEQLDYLLQKRAMLFAVIAFSLGMVSIYVMVSCLLSLSLKSSVGFKSLILSFYPVFIAITAFCTMKYKNALIVSFTAFNKSLNWKSSFLAGSIVGIFITFSYTYRIEYFPLFIQAPLLIVLGWMISFSTRSFVNLIIAQLFIMALWITGIFGEFAYLFHVYYLTALLFLSMGYIFGKFRLNFN